MFQKSIWRNQNVAGVPYTYGSILPLFLITPGGGHHHLSKAKASECPNSPRAWASISGVSPQPPHTHTSVPLCTCSALPGSLFLQHLRLSKPRCPSFQVHHLPRKPSYMPRGCAFSALCLHLCPPAPWWWVAGTVLGKDRFGRDLWGPWAYGLLGGHWRPLQ